MMKTIKNRSQIRDEKRRLRQRREDLEIRIRRQWQELKQELRPASIAGVALGSLMRPAEGRGVLRETLEYGLGLLAHKLVDTTGLRLGSLFRKR